MKEFTLHQLRLYGRQMIVPEVGKEGQQKISALSLRIHPEADPQTSEWARAFLERAGCTFSSTQGEPLVLPSTASVDSLAQHPGYRGVARLLMGSHRAVETLKEALNLPLSERPIPNPSDFNSER